MLNCWFYMVGFDTGTHLWRMYIRELSWDPHFFVLENKSIFLVAETCANNVQSLKEIHAWVDLELPLLKGPFSHNIRFFFDRVYPSNKWIAFKKCRLYRVNEKKLADGRTHERTDGREPLYDISSSGLRPVELKNSRQHAFFNFSEQISYQFMWIVRLVCSRTPKIKANRKSKN